MICFNSSLSIVSAFLLLILMVGIYFSINKTNFRGYAVGNKDFSTPTLVATVLATLYGGGGLLRNVQSIHELGLYWIVILILDSFGLWLIGRLALRMGPFMKHLSMAETIGDIYGRYPRIMAALVGIYVCTVTITIQINVISHAINMSIRMMDPFLITIFATLLLIFYSTFGGIRAVTFTDVLQFITFSIVIPLLAWAIFIKVGKPSAVIFSTLESQSKFQFKNLFHFSSDLLGMILLLLSFLISYIQPAIMQRVYMASGPIQARRVFSYATFFNIIIISFIILVGLFAFVGAPNLPKEAIWEYIISGLSPVFKGFLSISLLAMAMSTADSSLNSCSVMVSHDIVKSLQQKKQTSDILQLTIARMTTLVIGLLAMLLAFRCQDLLTLMYWSLDCAVPIVTAPLILAIFGFRGTSRTAVVGMVTGLLTILAWNKWIQPSTGIDGSFIAMVANGLAMLAEHYFLKQPEGAGWIGPDDQFKQIQQANARKREEQKEAIKNPSANRKAIFSEMIPSDGTLRLTGLYMLTTAILGYWFMKPDCIYWGIGQALFGAFFTSCKTFFSKATRGWLMGLVCLITLVLYLPLNLLWHWWHSIHPIFTASLSLTHSALILWILPLHLGIGVVATALLISIYPITSGLPLSTLSDLLPLFVASLLVCVIAISFKAKLSKLTAKILYLKNQEEIRASRKLKVSLYDASIVRSTKLRKEERYRPTLTQVVAKIEEPFPFLDSKMPLYKEYFQTIINKLYDWIAYFNRKVKSKKHALLQPTKVSVNRLMRKIELALAQEVGDPPRLLIENTRALSQDPSSHIVCDINLFIYLFIYLFICQLGLANW